MLEILNKTRNNLPTGRLFLKKIKDDILGEKYNLSLVITGRHLSSKLNFKYRKKNKPTNVLSFPLSKNEGEIFLNLDKIKKESKKIKINFRRHFISLFIHSLLHLDGLDHGKKMEKKETYYNNKHLG